MSNSLKVLADNRDALSLAEVIAWLHDYEKCTDEHLRGTTNNAPPLETDRDPTQYLSLIGMHTIHLLEEEVTLTELIKERSSSLDFMADTSRKWLIRALGFCHSAAHTEKADRSYYWRKQDFTDLRRSSPFGHDSSPPITSSASSLTDQLKSLIDQLKNLLPNLPSSRSKCRQCIENTFSYVLADTRRPLNEVTLWDWSNMVAALYKAAIAQALIDGLVEPPMLLHWRLLGVRIDGVAFSQNIARMPDLKSRQDLLMNGLDYVRILLEERYPLGTEVYRDTNGSIFVVPNIPYLLDLENEQGESLSDLIRRDFSTGTTKGNIFLKLGDEIVPTLEFELHKQAWFWDDSMPHHDPLPIVDHTTQTPASYAKPTTVRSWWQDHSDDICTVCQLRPQGWGAADNKAHYNRRARGVKCPSKPVCQTCKILERKVCAICEERREDRSERWTGDLKTTIWIDEVADANGRLALIVGKFGLEPWLDGTMIFYPAGHENRKIPAQLALKIRNMGASLTEGQVLKIQGNDYIWDDSLGVLKSRAEVKEELVPPRFKDDRLHIDTINEDVQVTDVQRLPQGTYRVAVTKLPPDLTAGSNLRIQGQDFYAVGDGKHVETASDRAAKVIEGKTLHSGYLVVEQAIRLYAMEEAQTPARLYRVWETTLQFWQNLKDELDIVGKVSPRLRVQVALPETELRDRLAGFHTYELKLRNINLSVTKVADQEFITVDNLQRATILLNPSKAKEYREDYEKAAEYMGEQLQELRRASEPIEIEQPTGYGSPNKSLGKLDIMSVNRENTPYVPAISILTEPRTFMVIVPADKALQVMQAIKEKYEQEMGKVRNRLSLITGIVFAGARTPLSAILDAGRRILNQPAPYEEWKIKRFEKIIESPNRGPWPSKVDFILEKDEYILPMKVQTVMRNGMTPDDWYPYWHMEAPIPDRWVLASDLGEGNTVSLMPSRFDFEFLDTAARRFEISYNNDKRRGVFLPGSTYHPARPYYLEQLDEFEKLWTTLSEGLETTQIDNLIGIIEEKHMEWLADRNDEVFKQAVYDALDNANWKAVKRPDADQFKQLRRAALSGQLTDVVELYMSILKQRPEADESQTKNITGVTL